MFKSLKPMKRLNPVGRILGDKWGKNKTEKYTVKKVGNKFMLFDNEVGEFLMGYTFEEREEAENFVRSL